MPAFLVIPIGAGTSAQEDPEDDSGGLEVRPSYSRPNRYIPPNRRPYGPLPEIQRRSVLGV